jgi:hypothetical protein
MVIAYKGIPFMGKVLGDTTEITPFIGTSSNESMTELVIGIFYKDTGFMWGLVAPHQLIKCYQAMNKLKDLPNIENNSLATVYESTKDGELPSFDILAGMIKELSFTHIDFDEIEHKIGKDFFNQFPLVAELCSKQNQEMEKFSDLRHLTFIETAKGNYHPFVIGATETINADRSNSQTVALHKGDKVKILSSYDDFDFGEFFDVEKDGLIEKSVNYCWFENHASWWREESFKGFMAHTKAKKYLKECLNKGYKAQIFKQGEYYDVRALASSEVNHRLYKEHKNKWYPNDKY